MAIRLIETKLPDFGVPKQRPQLPRSLYLARLDALHRARRQADLDTLLIYADREHMANLAWLTGFDPRFEEALLILAAGETPTLLTGPENLTRGRDAAIELEARLYPPFGRLGQDRSQTPALEEVLRNAGVLPGHRVGVLGWKYFGPFETPRPEAWFETPSYIIDTLRKIVGPSGRVVNAAGLLMDPTDGLRALNEIEQIAQFEHSAVECSEALKRLLNGLRPGMSEIEAAGQMRLAALPLSCHAILSSGPALSGLHSPSDRIIRRGDPLVTALGYWGGLSARMGFVAADAGDLPADAQDYVGRFAAPYFACLAEWYETIGIGVTGGTLDAVARRHLGTPFFNLTLNPGHLIHLDDWMNTPIFPDSTARLVSNQAIQCDIIPAPGPPYFGAGAEDGVALLDANGRAALRQRFPDIWGRIEARRAFMADILGIALKPEVMPLSNLAAALPPFLLTPDQLLTAA